MAEPKLLKFKAFSLFVFGWMMKKNVPRMNFLSQSDIKRRRKHISYRFCICVKWSDVWKQMILSCTNRMVISSPSDSDIMLESKASCSKKTFGWLWIMCLGKDSLRSFTKLLLPCWTSRAYSTRNIEEIVSISFSRAFRAVLCLMLVKQSKMWRHSINFDDGFIHLLRILLHYLCSLASSSKTVRKDWRRYAIRIYSTNHEIVHLSAFACFQWIKLNNSSWISRRRSVWAMSKLWKSLLVELTSEQKK